MSIWCSIDGNDYDLTPVDRDNYTGEPEPDGSAYFVDVATNHGFHDCTRLVVRRYEPVGNGATAMVADIVVLLKPREVQELAARLLGAVGES